DAGPIVPSRNRRIDGQTLIVGASGVIGRELARELCSTHNAVLAAMFEKVPPKGFEELGSDMQMVLGMDVRNPEMVKKVFDDNPDVYSVWHLAAVLSVQTAEDPDAARAVSVGGMKNIIEAMLRHSTARRLLFSDSIGSFGPESPRENATAEWLLTHPDQDPGSDYGLQKGECRKLLLEAAAKYGIDSRFAVIPGVLHTNPRWGRGTTEYVLDAIHAAVIGIVFENPVPMGVVLPMIHVKDLITGLYKLEMADRTDLRAPGAGYTFSGFSFAPEDLYRELVKLGLNPRWEDASEGSVQAKFARAWPNSVDGGDAKRDLGFSPKYDFESTINDIVRAHRAMASGIS
ncbi:MAG: NAD-dependent epimerase/dehydratase family protein, partial [Candidatus Gracilibacteria bacterium]